MAVLATLGLRFTMTRPGSCTCTREPRVGSSRSAVRAVRPVRFLDPPARRTGYLEFNVGFEGRAGHGAGPTTVANVGAGTETHRLMQYPPTVEHGPHRPSALLDSAMFS